jgi:HEAT repeat protein
MVDTINAKLIPLLSGPYPEELRAAAAKVLAEVGTKTPELGEALLEAIDDPSAAVRLQALTTIGRLRIDAALPRLIERISGGGAESELAAQAAARLGAKGTQALQNLMPQVAPGVRRRLASALAEGTSPAASTAAIDALLDSDPGVVHAAVSSLLGKIASLTSSQRRALAEQVLELVKPKKKQDLSVATESALVRLLAALADARGEAALWQRVDPAQPVELRIAAISALGSFSPPRDRNRIGQLLECAADRDFRVVAPALMILKTLPVPGARAADWLPLFHAPDPAVRRFAMQKLGDRDDGEVARALLAQLDHPDRALREEALTLLVKSNAGRELLVNALLDASTPDATWSLARPLARFAGQLTKQFGKIFKQASQYLEADDRRGEAVLFLLRDIDARSLRDRLEERALALRKKKKYEQAILYFRLMARDPACSEEVRFELAACGLKVAEHPSLAIESRNSDPALQQFARLLHNPDKDPLQRIREAKWLGPEELFYLGFHFIEGDRQERDFGAEALRLAIKRSPRSKIAKDARSKLRHAGMD